MNRECFGIVRPLGGSRAHHRSIHQRLVDSENTTRSFQIEQKPIQPTNVYAIPSGNHRLSLRIARHSEFVLVHDIRYCVSNASDVRPTSFATTFQLANLLIAI